MKNLFFAALLLFGACSSAHPTANENQNLDASLISFKVKNSSLSPRKVALIGYNPGETGNWTNIFTLLPGAHRSFSCPVGTKIYQANDQQVNTVMGGGSIRNDKPFITVKTEDRGKNFKL